MGTIVKRHLCRQLGLSPSRVYHCAIMPCYDKKLEGARDDFKLPGGLFMWHPLRAALAWHEGRCGTCNQIEPMFLAVL